MSARVWQIGPDGTEYYAASSEEEMRAYYIELLGEAVAKGDLDDYFEEVPEAKMDAEIDFVEEDGTVTKTTWRKLAADAKLPCQISSGYC